MSFKDQANKKGKLIYKSGNEFTPTELQDVIPDNLVEIEQQIFSLKNRTWQAAWHIGKRLIYIQEHDLVDGDFYRYLSDRFDFTPQTAYNFMFLAKNFEIKALLYGSKLYLLKGLDKKEIQKYLKLLEQKQLSYRELEDLIKSKKQPKITGRPPKLINLSKSRLTIDFKKHNIEIEKEKQEDFLNDLKKLIKKYRKK